MKTPRLVAVLVPLWILFVPGTHCQGDEARQVEQKALLSRLKYRDGEVQLRDGIAILQLGSEFQYLDPAGTDTLLTGIWGNPPSGGRLLGTIVPKGFDPFAASSWCVTIDFQEDGYVSDSDAGKINYDELLASMKREILQSNETRNKNGYPSLELVGWAAPPHYDRDTRKLYWAKELKFDGSSHYTLNYNIRILGRRGVLVLNAVAPMELLPAVQAATPDILQMVNFTPGNLYEDYKPGVDKIASYGLAALIAGGIAAKAGLFKWLIAGLIAFKKVIPVAVVALFALFKRIFGGKPAKNPLEDHQTVKPALKDSPPPQNP